MELRLFGQKQMANYMLNYFVQPEGINLLKIFPKIHVSRNSKNDCYTIRRLPDGKITAESNPKTEVFTRIPLPLVRFFWKNAKEIRFSEKTNQINERDLFEAKIVHSSIITKILKPENEYFRRELIAVLKILANPPDFPIVFKELIVLPQKKSRVKEYKKPYSLP